MSNLGGGARIQEEKKVVKIDPCGAIRFNPKSQNVLVPSFESEVR